MTGRAEAQNDMRREAIRRGGDSKIVDEFIRESNQAMEPLANGILAVFLKILAWVLLLFVMHAAYQIIPSLIGGLKVWLSNPFYRVVAVVIAIVFAWVLLVIKYRWMIAYGLMETAFGVATLYDNATDFSQDKASFLVMFAAMYILVSGFENLRNGYKVKHAKELHPT